MNEEEYIQLFEKYIAGSCSAEELKILNAANKDFKLEEEWDERKLGNKEELRRKIMIPLIKEIKRPRSLYNYKLLGAAAAILIITLSIGMYLWNNNSNFIKELPQNDTNILVTQNDKAILSLDDGTRIVLDSVNRGILFEKRGIQVQKNKEGEVIFNIHNTSLSNTASYGFNTISTPKGGFYQVVLPDGTKVWLNSASSLVFPTGFLEEERLVELQGEAYFEVSKDKTRPFRVKLKQGLVEVLGTHFNIKDYGEEEDVKTTLIEGSVKIVNTTGSKTLKPGQEAVFNGPNTQINIKPANIEEAIAWKNGLFSFNDRDLISVMREISRWYNVELEYEGDFTNQKVWGVISKKEKLEDVLKYLETGSIAKFKQNSRDGISGKERRITIMR